MAFEINIFIYIIFSIIEFNVVSKLANQLTRIEADKKREMIAVVIAAITVIALDILVYDFVKTDMRSVTSLLIIYIVLRFSKKISFTKAGIQLLVIMITIIIADIIVQIIGRLTLSGTLNEGINFTYMYGLLLIILNIIWLIMKKFNLAVLNLNKSKL
jgi:hypothetical protein